MAQKPRKTRYVSPPTPCPNEPPSAENGWWLYLSPIWHGHIQGLVKLLENRALWEGTEQQIDDTIGWVQDIEAGSIKDLSEVVDVRIQNGRLEFYNGVEWLDRGAVDQFTVSATTLPPGSNATADFDGSNIEFGIPQGEQGDTPNITVEAQTLPAGSDATADILNEHITFGIPRGADGLDGQDASGGFGELVLPATTTEDMHCYAATELESYLTDKAQDFLQTVEANADFIGEVADVVAELLGFGVGGEVSEVVTQGIIQNALDWMILNVIDVEARALVQSHIYCWLQSRPQNTWDTMLEIQNIDFPGGFPSPIFSGNAWDNAKDIIEFLFSIGSGEPAGYFTLVWASFVYNRATAALGITEPVSKSLAKMMNQAQYFDDRDCVSLTCPDTTCVNVTFENTDDYTVIEGTRVSTNGNPTWNIFDAQEPGTETAEIIVEFDTSGCLEVSHIDYQIFNTAIPSSDRNMFQRVRGWDGSQWVTLYDDVDLLSKDTWHELGRSWASDAYQKVELRIFSGWTSGSDGSIRLDNVVVLSS